MALRRAGVAQDASFADRVYREMLDEALLEDDVALLAIESLPLGPRLELTLDAHPGVLAGLRNTLGRWLSGERFDDDEVFDVALATSEAAANAVEHAYGAHAATFAVTGERNAREIIIVVQDRGNWRQARTSGRGRGLAIMRALVDSVEIERSEHGTTVTLRKRLDGRTP